jgi:methionine synthase I (cobalamin-dependent)
MRILAEALAREVLLADAGTEDRLRALRLDVARDLFGASGCFAVLSLTRAKMLRGMHEEQLYAGADVIRTNTRQASPLELRRFGLEEDAFAINYAAAQIASAAVDAVPGGDRRRFVLGIISDLGWDATSHDIEDATAIQASALLAGGADGLALELATDACRAPAFLQGERHAKEDSQSPAGLFIIQHGGDVSHGLSKLSDGVIRYQEITPSSSETACRIGVGVNLLGGTRPEHTASLDQLLRARAEESPRPSIVSRHSLEACTMPASSPLSRRHSVQRSREPSSSLAGNVIYCASRWAQRR